jgi:hypothetical protein
MTVISIELTFFGKWLLSWVTIRADGKTAGWRRDQGKQERRTGAKLEQELA